MKNPSAESGCGAHLPEPREIKHTHPLLVCCRRNILTNRHLPATEKCDSEQRGQPVCTRHAPTRPAQTHHASHPSYLPVPRHLHVQTKGEKSTPAFIQTGVKPRGLLCTNSPNDEVDDAEVEDLLVRVFVRDLLLLLLDLPHQLLSL